MYNETTNDNEKELIKTMEFDVQYDFEEENKDLKNKQSLEKNSKNYFSKKKSFNRHYKKSKLFF